MDTPPFTRFLGNWVLRPEQSRYEMGQSPQAGRYRLEAGREQIKVTMEWTAVDEQPFHQVYFNIPDGQDHPYLESHAVDATSMTLVDEWRLDSAAKKGGVVINHAARHLSNDGHTMNITMTHYTPNGTFVNESVYEREG
jgi:hypothetical protein